MRREIIGIFLFFFVIFTLISLLSYHPADPSISAGTGGRVHNLFGVVAPIGRAPDRLFGMGSFWIPLLLLGSLRFRQSIRPRDGLRQRGHPADLTTAGLLALHQDHALLFDKKFSSGDCSAFRSRRFWSNTPTPPAGSSFSSCSGWSAILATGFLFWPFQALPEGWVRCTIAC
jgi:S-DNA-T family DNA segregation ATPase FtsK/SpoIIIE